MIASSVNVARKKPSGAALKEEPRLKLADEAVQRSASFYRLVADGTRLRILGYLRQTKELHVRALCDLIGESQPSVSHHLGQLLREGIVGRRREGKHNYYSFAPRQFHAALELALADILPSQENSSSSA